MIFKVSKLEDNFWQEKYEQAMKELDDFYQLNWKHNRPQVMIVPDRQTIDDLRDRKSESWQVGWVNGGIAFILDNEAMETSSKHKKHSSEEYYSLIKHELSHIFFKHLAQGNGGPKWLWEGTAIYTAEQAFKKPVTKFERFLESVDSVKDGLYQESGFAVELLVKKYGKEKLFELIRALPKCPGYKDFLKKFEEIYSFAPTYENFNSLFA